jgi:hypothetical protein
MARACSMSKECFRGDKVVDICATTPPPYTKTQRRYLAMSPVRAFGCLVAAAVLSGCLAAKAPEAEKVLRLHGKV